MGAVAGKVAVYHLSSSVLNGQLPELRFRLVRIYKGVRIP